MDNACRRHVHAGVAQRRSAAQSPRTRLQQRIARARVLQRAAEHDAARCRVEVLRHAALPQARLFAISRCAAAADRDAADRGIERERVVEHAGHRTFVLARRVERRRRSHDRRTGCARTRSPARRPACWCGSRAARASRSSPLPSNTQCDTTTVAFWPWIETTCAPPVLSPRSVRCSSAKRTGGAPGSRMSNSADAPCPSTTVAPGARSWIQQPSFQPPVNDAPCASNA